MGTKIDDNPSSVSHVEPLAGVEPRMDRIVTIPLWGHTGHGKTTALLAAHAHLDPLLDGVGLELVHEPDELLLAIESDPSLGMLGLTEVASRTAECIGPQLATFTEDCKWPPGTDASQAYLFRITTLSGGMGFVYMPDFPGGSYKDSLDDARAVLRTSHACGIIVDPDEYMLSTARHYRSAVLQRVQACNSLGIPVAIMVSKADAAESGATSAADQAQSRLALLAKDNEVRIFRVSVLKDEPIPDQLISRGEERPDPIPMEDRDPAQLKQAIIWLLQSALSRPAAEIRKKQPKLHLRAIANAGAIDAKIVSEMRIRSAHSIDPGVLVGARPASTNGAPRFVGLQPDGQLIEVAFSSGSEAMPRVEPAGSLQDFPQDLSSTNASEGDQEGASEKVAVRISRSGVWAGAASGAQALWHGTLGDAVPKIQLPFQVQAWLPVGPGRVITLDSEGRLHDLRLLGDTWKVEHYLPSVLEGPEPRILARLTSPNLIVALASETHCAIELKSDGFGAKHHLDVMPKFQTRSVELSPSGIFATVGRDGKLRAGPRRGTVSLGGAQIANSSAFVLPWAAAHKSHLIAFPDAAGLVHAAQFIDREDQPRREDEAANLGGPASSLCWSLDDRWLAVSTAAGELMLIEPVGWQRHD